MRGTVRRDRLTDECTASTGLRQGARIPASDVIRLDR